MAQEAPEKLLEVFEEKLQDFEDTKDGNLPKGKTFDFYVGDKEPERILLAENDNGYKYNGSKGDILWAGRLVIGDDGRIASINNNNEHYPMDKSKIEEFAQAWGISGVSMIIVPHDK